MTRKVKQTYFHVDWFTINLIEVQADYPFREGVVYNAEEDVYTIVLNYELSPERKKKAFRHAMHHIMQEDFFKYDVQDIERTAHREAT